MQVEHSPVGSEDQVLTGELEEDVYRSILLRYHLTNHPTLRYYLKIHFSVCSHQNCPIWIWAISKSLVWEIYSSCEYLWIQAQKWGPYIVVTAPIVYVDDKIITGDDGKEIVKISRYSWHSRFTFVIFYYF